MIPGITEVNFPSYATLHQATVSLNEMGERTISTQVRIDGDIVPNFSGWELQFRGETFVLPTQKPQASKDNSSRYALVDLVFMSSPIFELKRYFFAEMAEVETGTLIIDKYTSSLRLNLTNFVAAFNRVLGYYYNGSIVMSLNPYYQDSGEVKDMSIDYSYIWDVLTNMHDVYNVSWSFYRSGSVTTIRVGYDAGVIDDHIFQYGFEGGLLRFERHVEDTDIYNVLLGRGGEKNLPYRYFKQTDEYNPIWSADPDAIPELRNIYFSRLLDSNFRSYVQGWKTNSHRDTSTWPGTVVEQYDSARGATDWAYAKGHTDTKFDPVEYVKDDESIALYGVRQGKLDDNDDIFPTIQGVWLDNIGRADEVVDVHIAAEGSQEAQDDIVTVLSDILLSVNEQYEWVSKQVDGSYSFTVPEKRVGNIIYAWAAEGLTSRSEDPTGYIDTTNSNVMVEKAPFPSGDWHIYQETSGISPGEYRIHLVMRINRSDGYGTIQGKFGINQVELHCTPAEGISNRRIFTIWVKNIWESTQGAETDTEYAHRIWDPILGDRLGNQAAVMFSDGWMSASEDYEFLIYKLPEVDRTKSINTVDENGNPITVYSEWKITLVRSDAEYEATGLFIPNTDTGGVPVAGNHFFFTGIDMPINYVRWAEKKVTREKEKQLEEKAWTNATWNISLDKIKAHEAEQYANSLAGRLDAGTIVNITDPRFTPGKILSLGVRTLTFSWREPSGSSPYTVPDIEIVLSDKLAAMQSIDDIRNDVNYISQNYVKNSAVKKLKITTNVIGAGSDISLGTVIGTVSE